MTAQKSTPLNKEEVMQLINLVEVNPVVYSKATNTTNNMLKDTTWAKITDSFNAMIAGNPRKPEQLRLKWENLKKAARKRNARIRMNTLKTGGGKPDYIPPDDALDKVAGILGPTCDGYSVSLGGDAGVVEGVDLEMVEESPINEVPLEETSPVVVTPTLSPHVSRTKFFFSSVVSKGKQKRQTLANELKESIRDRNRAVADYYISKKATEEEISRLKKIKLELEIKNLEKVLNL